jgi:deoxyribose-phosphate aldolase
MYLEYACYDYSLSDEELKNNISQAIKLGVKNISVHYLHLPILKSILGEMPINISCPIDYPYGLSDPKIRLMSIASAAKNGATIVDMVIPAKCISNRKYDKLRDDIKNNLTFCQENNLIIRYILEYRVFNHETLAKTCQILKTLGIDCAIPSTGHMIDDINDNLIAAKYLMAKSQINIITNGNIWSQKHIDSIKGSGVYGARFHYLPALELFLQNI